MSRQPVPFVFFEGNRVRKSGGDYQFVGTVQAIFRKRNGVPRYVVENDAGLLHIFNGDQLMRAADETLDHGPHAGRE